MAAGDRVRSALMFALVVASTQAACLFVIWTVGLLPSTYPTGKRAGTGPLFQVVTFGLLLAVPVLLHDGPVARRWPPRASRQATIVFSLAGLGAGLVLAGVLADNGDLASRTLGALAGPAVGSFVAVALLNLFASSS